MGRNRAKGTRMTDERFRLMRCGECGRIYRDYEPYPRASVCPSCGSFGAAIAERTRKVEVAPRRGKFI